MFAYWNDSLALMYRFGNEELANEVESLMTKELEREAAAFKYVRSLKPSVATDTALLKLSAILTHNVGDVDQGLNYWQVCGVVCCVWCGVV
jgi:hypothetical protein